MPSNFLTLYIDPLWRRRDLLHSAFLYPFWGNPPKQAGVLLRGMLFQRQEFDMNYYGITEDVSKADAVFMPYSHATVRHSYPELLSTCSEVATRAGLPLIVDGMEDVEHEIATPRTIVFRYGGYRFEKKKNVIVLPPFANDMLELHCDGKLRPIAKEEKPTIGFSGWGYLSPYRRLRALAKGFPDRIHSIFDGRYGAKKKGVFFREAAMHILSRSPLVESHFIVRSNYSGHAQTATKGIADLQKEFVSNLLDCQYGLDIRGDANNSTRLFEILSLGRIPVIVDTERNFPFSDAVDYRQFALVVDFRELAKLPERIATFHNSVSPEEFENMQRKAREAYVTYFRVDALMPHIVREFWRMRDTLPGI